MSGRGRLSRLRAAALFGPLALAAVALPLVAWRSPEVPFLCPTGPARWIQYPSPVDTVAIHGAGAGATRFEHRFRVPDATGPWTLSVQSFGEPRVRVNGRPVPLGRRENWKSASTAPLDDLVRSGENRLQVDVRNPRGPALLRLRVEGPRSSVSTGPRWLAREQGRPVAPARVAEDTAAAPDEAMPDALRGLIEQRALLLAWFAVALVGAYGATRLPRRLVDRLPRVVLAAATLAWAVFFWLKLRPMRAAAGFDVAGHLEYIGYLLVEGRLPLAGEGWSTYHPPLFYLISAAIARAAGLTPPGQPERLWLLRIVPCVAGLASVWATHFVARRLFAGKPVRVALATAIAATLPMNVYMSAYVSNEALHAGLVSLALIPACRMLIPGERPGRVRDAWLCGALLGLAVLTKFTALLVLPLVVGFLTLGTRAALRARAVRRGAVVALSAGLVGGWFYLRNWIRLGRPLVGNWEQAWWQYPGFHTPAYYLGFGESLRRPFFAGFHSFWDGIYSTLWGDGLVGGRSAFAARHAMWNYDLMATIYPLALPLTLIALLGWILAARRSLAEPDPGRAAFWGLSAAMILTVGLAAIYMSLRLPYYAQAKAFYALCTIVPFALTTAAGFDFVAGRMPRVLRLPLYAWLATLFALVALTFLA